MLKIAMITLTLFVSNLALAKGAPIKPGDQFLINNHGICKIIRPIGGGLYEKLENGMIGVISESELNDSNCFKVSQANTEDNSIDTAEIQTQDISVEGMNTYSSH